MAESEERPFKIRRIDSSIDEDTCATDKKISNGGGANAPKNEDATPEEGNSEDEKLSISSPNGEKDVIKSTGESQLPKSQLKKIRRRLEWEAGREYRKAKRKEKGKAKKARKAEERAVKADGAVPKIEASVPPPRSHQRPVQVPLTLVLDCAFDDFMSEKEMISLGAQLTRCYSDNRTAKYRVHLMISSFSGKLKDRYESALANTHLGWKGVKFMEEDFRIAAQQSVTIMRSKGGGRVVGALAGPPEAVSDLCPSAPECSKPVELELPASTLTETKIPTSENADIEALSVDPTQLEQQSSIVPEASPSQPLQVVQAAAAKPQGVPCYCTTENKGSSPNKDNTEIRADVLGKELTVETTPSIIYLTSDSPHTLDRLSPYTTYIIGGIVDKNRHKGLCYKRACERGIATARLPIGEYMTMQSRVVLATNHVVEIMIRWLDCGDWGQAFLQVIPKRKEAKLKVERRNDSDDGREHENEDGCVDNREDIDMDERDKA